MNKRLKTLPNELNEFQFEAVNLTNCDREPIHIPSLIQPHGLLLVLTDPDLRIAQVSGNSLEILGIASEDLLDRPLEEFIETEIITSIWECLERSFEKTNPICINFYGLTDALYQSFNGIVHRSPSNEIVLELEPLETKLEHDFFQFYRQVKSTLTKMQMAQDLTELCDLVVQEVQSLTGFDRVMIYRFNEQGDGTVIAETKQPDLEPFLGLHYPDSDIPKQAKHLYTLNWLRLIPNVNYQPTGLVRSEQFPISQPLDMSYCNLRSVSPMHIEYLQNMGVAASMSVSLIQNQKLWGLIACHHGVPKFVPYEIRTICEFLGQLMSTELANKESNINLDYKLQLKKIQGQFLERLAKATEFVDEIAADRESLLNLTSAQGAVICDGDRLILIGETPSEQDLQSLVTWLQDQFEQAQSDLDLFVTDALSSLYPEAKEYQAIASGLIAMAISKTQHRYILWFRPEQLQTVTWAGQIDKNERVAEDGSILLFPRQSFEAWKQIVCGKSNPWLSCEIEGVLELQQAIVNIVLKQTSEIAIINSELKRSNSELDAFAYIASHDLKEPLRGIHNYATFLLEDYGEILKEDGADKLHTLVRLTKRMESLIDSLLKFSRLGRQELQMEQIDLNQLLHNVTEIFAMNPQWVNCEIRVPRSLPTIWGDRLLIEEVFINLIANAFKYNESPEKWVEIDWLMDRNQSNNHFVSISVRDNGIGIREKHLETVFQIFKRLNSPSKYGGGTGAGLTIVRKIVERHGGSIQAKSHPDQGTTFSFSLPTSNPNK